MKNVFWRHMFLNNTFTVIVILHKKIIFFENTLYKITKICYTIGAVKGSFPMSPACLSEALRAFPQLIPNLRRNTV